jgi:hypothetical protein
MRFTLRNPSSDLTEVSRSGCYGHLSIDSSDWVHVDILADYGGDVIGVAMAGMRHCLTCLLRSCPLRAVDEEGLDADNGSFLKLFLQEAIQAVRDSLEGEETVEECPTESEDSEK